MFEDVVTPHDAPAGRRRMAVGPVAIGAHALVIAGALLSALVNGEDLPAPDPPVPIVFVETLSLPHAGPPPPAGTSANAQTPGRQAATAALPRHISEAAPVSEDLDERSASWDEAEGPGSGPPGDPSGVVGGTDEKGPCRLCPPGGDVVHEVGGEIVPPRLLHKVEPVYSDVARKLRIEGVLIVRAIIGLDGRVEDLRIEKALSPSLDEAALAALGQWRYEPATLKGRVVRVALTVTVRFQLR